MCEDFKWSNWKSRKGENINKYYLTTTKVKMKWRTVEFKAWNSRSLICFAGTIGIFNILIHFSIKGGCWNNVEMKGCIIVIGLCASHKIKR